MDDRPKRGERSPLSDRRFSQLIIGSLALGFLCLAIAAGTALWLVGRSIEFSSQVSHTYGVESRLSEFRVQLERAEASRRGYLLTREGPYFDIYRASADQLPVILKDLRAQTVDNPAQQQRLDVLDRLTEQQLSLLQRSVETARSGAMAAAIRIFQLESNDLIQSIRRVTGEMAAEESRLLQIRSERQNANAQLLLLVVVGVGVLLGLLALLSFGIMRRYARDLRRSEGRLKVLNEGLEAAVADRTADLTRANAEIQRFAYIVSHDLRSPLVNVMGFTSELELSVEPMRKLIETVEQDAPQLLSRDVKIAVEQDMPEAIGFIRSSTQKMDRLINAILKLSREGRRSLTPETIALQPMIEGVADSLRHQLQDRDAEIVVETPLPSLSADRLALEQIIGNLVENAVKYLKPGRPGRIVVRAREALGRTIIEVEDNGRGIAPQDHERIFELFRRSGAQDQPGEGIGLAHVRALAYRLGGTIDCSSTLDHGATFRLSLPTAGVRDREIAE